MSRQRCRSAWETEKIPLSKEEKMTNRLLKACSGRDDNIQSAIFQQYFHIEQINVFVEPEEYGRGLAIVARPLYFKYK